jgi:hypothetical protein
MINQKVGFRIREKLIKDLVCGCHTRCHPKVLRFGTYGGSHGESIHSDILGAFSNWLVNALAKVERFSDSEIFRRIIH